MKKQYGFCRMVLLLCAWLFSIAVWADNFVVDGICYNILSSDDKTVAVTKSYSSDYSGDVVIPETVTKEGIEYRVTAIGDGAFRYCDYLKSVTIPESITAIGDEAFFRCDNLTSVTIGEGVTTIGELAFSMCYSLTSITIPGSVTSIGDEAFSRCYGLTSVTIPESVTSIGLRAFFNCTGLARFEGKFAADGHCLIVNDTLKAFAPSGLTQYTIPDDVTVIGEGAFQACHGLTSVTIPESVQSIGESAFSDCDGMISITIPESVTSIGDAAFFQCRGLTSITIENGVQSIDDNAFYLCIGLTSVTIPESVTSVGNRAFYLCWNLTSITIPENVTFIGMGAFGNCSGLTEFKGKFASDNGHCLIVNDTLKAFAPNCGLSEYTIPDGVKVIGDYAFSNCTGLASVTIPNSVTSIGAGAFYGCTGLTSVTAYNPTPVDIVVTSEWWGGSCFAFENVDCANCTLYVPAESVNEYQLAEGWREFGEILPIDESSAITEIRQDNADGHVTVYNLQGVLVLETDDAADLKTLQNGTYIVNGKTMIIAR